MLLLFAGKDSSSGGMMRGRPWASHCSAQPLKVNEALWNWKAQELSCGLKTWAERMHCAPSRSPSPAADELETTSHTGLLGENWARVCMWEAAEEY